MRAAENISQLSAKSKEADARLKAMLEVWRQKEVSPQPKARATAESSKLFSSVPELHPNDQFHKVSLVVVVITVSHAMQPGIDCVPSCMPSRAWLAGGLMHQTRKDWCHFHVDLPCMPGHK